MGERLTTGIAKLDDILGGGLIPGKKTLVYGATGVGKSVLGVEISHAGIQAEGHPGIILDVSHGLDSQSQLEYARGMLGWNLKNWMNLNQTAFTPDDLKSSAYLNTLLGLIKLNQYDLRHPRWLAQNFFSYHLPRTRRIIVDGSEPYEMPSSSKTLNEIKSFFNELERLNEVHVITRNADFEVEPLPLNAKRYWNLTTSGDDVAKYVQTGEGQTKYGHYNAGSINWDRYILRPNGQKEANAKAESVKSNSIASVVMQTTEERDIFKLANQKAPAGSLDSEVSTVIVMGFLPITEQRQEQRRALVVIKYRGSTYDGLMAEYQITNRGLEIMPQIRAA